MRGKISRAIEKARRTLQNTSVIWAFLMQVYQFTVYSSCIVYYILELFQFSDALRLWSSSGGCLVIGSSSFLGEGTHYSNSQLPADYIGRNSKLRTCYSLAHRPISSSNYKALPMITKKGMLFSTGTAFQFIVQIL